MRLQILTQVLCFLVMCTLSIADTIAQSFFANYMLNAHHLDSDTSGWIMTVAGVFYTVATFLSGIVGSNKKVGFVIRSNNSSHEIKEAQK